MIMGIELTDNEHVVKMDKVICVNCGNEVIYDFNLLNKYFTKIHNNITTDIIKDKITTLKYFRYSN